MILRHSNLWESPAGLILVTTNQIINRHGRLVMGRGAALEACVRYPDCDLEFGRLVHAFNSRLKRTFELPYGVLIHPNKRLGIFQVKYHYAGKASLELIAYSTTKLADMARLTPSLTIAMNFPGIGAGGLDRDRVLPIISTLPDSVEVHEIDHYDWPYD